MRTTLTFVLASLLLVGCDSLFIRRVEVIPERSADGSLALPDVSRVKASIEAYAREAGLECSDGDGSLIIECRHQPVVVRAVQMQNSIAVCYAALGVPFEARKFNARMDSMQRHLTQTFGPDVVRVMSGNCPPR